MSLFSARARTKAKEGVTEGWFAKFPKDVIYCEQLTNGNPNILNEEPFVDKKKEKVDYSLIFGDPDEIQQKKEDIIQKSVIKKIRSREDGGAVSSPKPITHPRFLGLAQSIYERRGKQKVEIKVPIYQDENTNLTEATEREPFPGNIYMDSMHFGMGSSCLQITYET